MNGVLAPAARLLALLPGECQSLTDVRGRVQGAVAQKSSIFCLAALVFPGCQYLLRRTISVVRHYFLQSHLLSVGVSRLESAGFNTPRQQWGLVHGKSIASAQRLSPDHRRDT